MYVSNKKMIYILRSPLNIWSIDILVNFKPVFLGDWHSSVLILPNCIIDLGSTFKYN